MCGSADCRTGTDTFPSVHHLTTQKGKAPKKPTRLPPRLLPLDPVSLAVADATVGNIVAIHGCIKGTQYNGVVGTIKDPYNAATKRVAVTVPPRHPSAPAETKAFKLCNLALCYSSAANWEEFVAMTPPPHFSDTSLVPREYHNSGIFEDPFVTLLEGCYGKDNSDADALLLSTGDGSGDGLPLLAFAVANCDLMLIKALGRKNADFSENTKIVSKARSIKLGKSQGKEPLPRKTTTQVLPNTSPLAMLLMMWAGLETRAANKMNVPLHSGPLVRLYGRRRIETIDFLLSAGADPNVSCGDGYTLLHLAVLAENADPDDADAAALLPLLLRHKADPACVDMHGKRPQDYYLPDHKRSKDKHARFRELVARFADLPRPTTRCPCGSNRLQMACHGMTGDRKAPKVPVHRDGLCPCGAKAFRTYKDCCYRRRIAWYVCLGSAWVFCAGPRAGHVHAHVHPCTRTPLSNHNLIRCTGWHCTALHHTALYRTTLRTLQLLL